MRNIVNLIASDFSTSSLCFALANPSYGGDIVRNVYVYVDTWIFTLLTVAVDEVCVKNTQDFQVKLKSGARRIFYRHTHKYRSFVSLQ